MEDDKRVPEFEIDRFPGAWVQEAACRGTKTPDAFYPDPAEQPEHTVIQLCAGCPVRVPCLHHALLAGERYGVWGGMTATERAILVYGDPTSSQPGRVA